LPFEPRSVLGKEGAKGSLEPGKHTVPWWVQTPFPGAVIRKPKAWGSAGLKNGIMATAKGGGEAVLEPSVSPCSNQ